LPHKIKSAQILLYVRQLINYNYNIVFTTLSAKAFSVSAPSVWNSLSYNCRSSESFSSFRRALKTELSDTAYSERKHSA